MKTLTFQSTSFRFFLPLLFLPSLSAADLNSCGIALLAQNISSLRIPNMKAIDYTAKYSQKKVDNWIDAEDLEEEDLLEDVKDVFSKAKDGKKLLGVILSQQPVKDRDDEVGGDGHISPTHQAVRYRKYMLSSAGIVGLKARRMAHKLGYHLVQTPRFDNILVTFLAWLQVSPERYIVDLSTGSDLKESQTLIQKLMGLSGQGGGQLKKENITLKETIKKISIELNKQKRMIQEEVKQLALQTEELRLTKERAAQVEDQLKKEKKENRKLHEQLLKVQKDLAASQALIEDIQFKKVFKNKKLPKSLAGKDLTGSEFTGCHFTNTDLTDTILQDAILKNTTCDYLSSFQANVKANQLSGGDWYLKNLPKELKSITKVYPKIQKDSDKAELLYVACGFSRLPYYSDKEFYIKVEYWSSILLCLKKRVGQLGRGLTCLLESDFEYEANDYCWGTTYPQDKINFTKVSNSPEDPPDHDAYIQGFKEGLKKYKCTSKRIIGFNWYRERVEKNLQGLQKTYLKIQSKDLQKEVIWIAESLSKIYQYQHFDFLHRFLFFQNRLIRLKNLVGDPAGNEIYYKDLRCLLFSSWDLYTK